MSEPIVVPQIDPAAGASQFAGDALRVAPGILLLAAVGYGGKLLEQGIAAYGKAHHLTLPNIEYVLWAILIGLAIDHH